MRIPRTNFPVKADEYGFENSGGEVVVHVPVPPSRPVDLANADSPTLYESVTVKRAIANATPRPVPVPTGGFDAGTSFAPISKRMFSLSENVRFTRTPDSELLKNKGPAPTEHTMAPKADAKRPATAKPARNLEAIVVPPHVPDVESGGSLLFSQPIPVQSLAVVVPQRPAVAEAHTTGRTPAPARSPLAYVSDYAFFESADFIGGIALVAAASPVKPMPKFSPDQITANFRVVEPFVTQKAPLMSPPLDSVRVDHHAAPMPEQQPGESDTVDAGLNAIPEAVPAVTPERTIARRREIAPVQAPLPPRQIAIADPVKPRNVPAPRATYEKPPVTLLQEALTQDVVTISQETLEQNAGLLESVLEDFGIRGEIIHVRPGPVVTLYEFEPAPGVKSSRVIGLADDIARSMSALSARVAVVPGRNVIGIELPNTTRETVYLREMVGSENFDKTRFKLALCLGKTIGGEPVIAELAKMPHLLVAGTTGSGKSVAINTMILSLLYRLTPDECRLIMVDPKMLELSIYDGIPHLLTPVVTDPKKAVMALKWAVREMEDRYRKMSKLGVRNIDGFNTRVVSAKEKGETVMCTVQTGFDKGTGEAQYQQEAMDLTPMPYIVIIVDEMADLMMVAGKDIEGAIQRLAQMARAAGIHLIMATQRPSVDVITGTIKANFPTRISFQVTSKIDSRTILGEQGAEQLLGQGDMLHMIGGGRISRVHGPFVSDEEVEKVVAHLKTQGQPDYLDTVTADESEEDDADTDDSAVFDKGALAAEDGNELYDQAVKVMLRDKKCSTSYIQRRLQIGYNRAASLVERMEKEGLVGPSNHVGKREILNVNRDTG
ncbi:S-DNA-T family DNA segregation ATPase FtsK/SpoIIIE [Phyllobacterium sp. 1468]|uniref:DNA translocase FtsK n=1 Tax=Phyllobacterium sp. 1468 TaxID=2817759 RepID=UPI002854604E|nr:DNA translocase FtsK [Phyllobacterium sp. 1468]MDR6635282.1 S-DNA-T family DNA segregation ATPase FtsK/SpoIIIE [Phyllobacterium sp. 1468]